MAIDGREEAPARFHPNSFCAGAACAAGPCDCNDGPAAAFEDLMAGGHSVGVPGVVRAMERLLKDHGSISFAASLAPAIARARAGWPMYWHMHYRINTSLSRSPRPPSLHAALKVS